VRPTDSMFSSGPFKFKVLVLLFSWSISGHSETVQGLMEQLNSYPHANAIASSTSDVRDHEVGLGPIEKVGGQWNFKVGERSTGTLQRGTWQITDGFTSLEVLEALTVTLEADSEYELLFSCDGRSCGQGVQWANRVFKQRILYGREEMQRYRVYSLGSTAQYRVMLYSAARTADRQYLHMEVLERAP
jgi:hypothetical protein